MTSRELRKQRREEERKARKLAYRQSRAAAAQMSGARSLAGEPVARPAFTPNPDLFDEFSAEEQMKMMAIRARVHARAGITDLPQSSTAPESRVDPLVRMPVPRPALSASERTGPTGPRSPEGKATSSGNSLKHGLASGRVIIPGEDPAEFEALVSDLIKEHAPANATESLLVQQMAQSWWLMQRAIRLQNQAFAETRVDTHKLALFLRYQTTHERAFYKALNTLTKLKLSRAREQAVSSRRKSSPEFVSQKPVGARHASPVLQKTGSAPEFVSQSQPPMSHDIGFVSQNPLTALR
jgi:hypothetical protein